MIRRVGLGLFLFACGGEPAPHPAYRFGVESLEQAAAETLDPDFGSPRFLAALRAFELVPEDAPEYVAAQSLARRLRTARVRFEAQQAQRKALVEEQAERERVEQEALAKRVREEAAADRERVRAEVREEARRQAEEVRRAAARTRAAGEQARAMAKRRAERRAERRRDREAREARFRWEERRQEACLTERAACRDRCVWVRDTTGRSGGLGSPISMKCMERCPVCEDMR